MYISFYNGKDLFNDETKDKSENAVYSQYGEKTGYIQSNSKNGMNINWGNTILATRWNYIFNNKLFSNSTISFNQYNFKMNLVDYNKITSENFYDENNYQAKYQSGIKDFAYNIDFDYNPVPSHHIKFGGGYMYHHFRPEIITSTNYEASNKKIEDNTYYSIQNPNIYAHELSAYLEDNFDLTHRLSMNAGLHFSGFNVQNKSYFSFQPRMSFRYKITNDFTLKTSYTKMSQYIHLLGSSAVSLPTDLWVPVTRTIKPMRAHQYSLGTYYTGIKGWEFSIESYYKNLINVLEYKDGSTFLGSSSGWENKVEMGKGRSYGIEFLAQKTVGKSTGWIGYTLARSERQFSKNGINSGKIFPYKYDRRHNINIVFNHKFSDRINICSSWTYYSGGTITISEEKTAIIQPNEYNKTSIYSEQPNTTNLFSENYIEKRNNYRLPSTHLLNIGINFNKKTKHGLRTWNISLYNTYNAMNPTFIYKKENKEVVDGQTIIKPVLKKYTLLPCIPSITYTYKF